jgi:TonB-dependent starch-binding outer membrane protein SusC
MKTKLLFLIVLSFLCMTTISAQKSNKKLTITGTVLNADSVPIPNAMIMIDGQKTNAVTNAKGEYKLKVKPTAQRIGVFSLGSGIREEEINGRNQINIGFSSSSKQANTAADEEGEEGVGIGYGSVKKKNVTTQINSIDGSKKKYASYSSIYDMIQREVTGVRINGSSVIIQGSKDLFGDVPALIVVDGVPVNSVNNISPTVVKSIEVLKGSAAAIYGSRAYGGVILIKTKKEVQ